MPVIDEISDLDFDHLSSVDKTCEMHEQELLEGEIYKKSIEQYQQDPDSIKFGEEFKDITASGYEYANGFNKTRIYFIKNNNHAKVFSIQSLTASSSSP